MKSDPKVATLRVVRGEKPRVPVPYRTFSETFSYGAPEMR